LFHERLGLTFDTKETVIELNGVSIDTLLNQTLISSWLVHLMHLKAYSTDAPIVMVSTPNAPEGLSVDFAGDVYVADFFGYRIQKFDSNGKFITKWGSGQPDSGDGKFGLDRWGGPSDVAVDNRGHVYVVEAGNNRIQKFDSNGKFITKWGNEGLYTFL
jgi:DNA-binding beta-propeller fold protein YncE